MLIPVWFSSLAGKLRLVQPLFSHRYGKAHPREMMVVRFDVDVKCRQGLTYGAKQIKLARISHMKTSLGLTYATTQGLTYDRKQGLTLERRHGLTKVGCVVTQGSTCVLKPQRQKAVSQKAGSHRRKGLTESNVSQKATSHRKEGLT